MNWWKWLLVSLGLVAVLLRVDDLLSEDNNLSVTAPTEREDGEPLNDLDVIRFHHSVDSQGGPYEPIGDVEAEPGERVTFLHADQDQGLHCYIATAIDLNGNESAPSNEACKLVDTIAPGSPENLEVQ